jgi:hypothetical protein
MTGTQQCHTPTHKQVFMTGQRDLSERVQLLLSNTESFEVSHLGGHFFYP